MRRTLLAMTLAIAATSAVVYASTRPDEPRLVSFVRQRSETGAPDPTSPTPASSDAGQPAVLCLQALPEQYLLVNATLTTVGEIRQERGGPMTATGEPGLLWPDAFPELPESEEAAWCNANTGERYVAYAAARGQYLELVTLSGLTAPPPPGPPIIE